jgi:biopolymer transport protein ExbD
MLRARRTSVAPSVEITPLIDVVFLLLTFFVFALILTVRMDATDIRLPEVRSGDQATLTSPPVVVGMTAEGAVSIGEQILAGPDSPIDDEVGLLIRAAMLESAGIAEADLADPATPGLPVLMLAIDEQARHGRILELLDSLRQVGVSDFRYLRSPRNEGFSSGANPGPTER